MSLNAPADRRRTSSFLAPIAQLAAAGAFGAVVVQLLLGTVWTPQRTWARGDHVTESRLNTYLRDDVTFIYDNQAALSGFFSGLSLGTSRDNNLAKRGISMDKLDRVAFDNAVVKSNIGFKSALMTILGSGGLDTGTEAASTWYEIYIIEEAATGATALLMHRARDFFLDETYDSDDATVEIQKSTGTRTALAQGFKVDTAGYIDHIDVELIRVGSVATGKSMWAEIQADTAGLPSDGDLAISDFMEASRVSTSSQWIRFVFRSPVSVAASTQYHLVLKGDWTASDAVYVGWRCDTSAATYANGTRTQREAGTWNSTGTTAHDFSFKVYVTRNETAVTMPSPYDGKCLIGYVYNDSASDLKPFTAINRSVSPGAEAFATALSATVPRLIDLTTFVPPVPVTFGATANLFDSANVQRIGGVPNGYELATTSPSYFAGTPTAGTVQSGVMVPANTESQAIYLSQDAGVATAQIGSWSW